MSGRERRDEDGGGIVGQGAVKSVGIWIEVTEPRSMHCSQVTETLR